MISLWMSYGSSLNDLPRLPPGAVGPGSWSTPGMLRAWPVAAESLGGVVQHGGTGVRGGESYICRHFKSRGKDMRISIAMGVPQ